MLAWLRKLARREPPDEADEPRREIQEGLDLHFGSNHAGGHHDELGGMNDEGPPRGGPSSDW
jgi:hypothetical protein